MEKFDSDRSQSSEQQGLMTGNTPLGTGRRNSSAAAFGGGTSEPDAIGAFSWAQGYQAMASGEGSVAAGFACVASGAYTVSLGTENEASGSFASTVGAFNHASGAGSFAAGAGNAASGDYAGAFGCGTVAASYAEFVVGSYNEPAVETAETAAHRSRPADRALVVGIGTDQAHRRDGFVVYKDGSLGLCKLAAAPPQPAGRLYNVAGQLHFNGQPLTLTNQAVGGESAPQWHFAAATNKVEIDFAKHRGADLELALTNSVGEVGSKLLLQNDKQALRFGRFPEKDANHPVGQLSVSLGDNSTASGRASFAAGENAMARGQWAVAMGYQAEASGKHAFAAGADSDNKHSLANGDCSVALSGGRAHGEHAIALAQGFAEGEHAIATGYGSQALGKASVALGHFAVAYSYGEVVVGTNNTEYTPQKTLDYAEADRAFCVGVGRANPDIYYTTPKDALLVFKNGRVIINNEEKVDGTHSIVKGLAPAQLQVNAQESDGLTIHTGSSRNTLNLVKAAGTSNSTFASFGYLAASEGTAYREIGSIRADGGNGIKLVTSSDARLKNDLGMVTGSLEALMQVKIHDFTWKSNGVADVGVFAQELHNVYPAAVEKGDDGAEIQQGWMVDYTKLQPLAIAALQELQQTVVQQQQQIEELKQQVALLMQRQ